MSDFFRGIVKELNDENTSIADFVAALTPAPEATMMVQDAEGNEKTTGTVEATDVVVVTAGDEINVVTYTINVLVSVYNSLSDQIRVYPNPAKEILYVENIPMNTRVRITDVTGRTRKLMHAVDVEGGINLKGMQNGMYFMSVEKEGIKLASIKVLIK